MGSDDRRIYDMAVRRFLAVFHPEAVFENTRVETTVTAADGERHTSSAPAASCCSCPAGAASTTRSQPTPKPPSERGDEDEAADQQLPRLLQDERCRRARSRAPARKPNRPALQRRVAARRDGDRRQAGRRRRAARGDEGLGDRHPGHARGDHRAADHVGYVERDGRALVATEKGLNVIRLLNEHALTSPGLTGSWEQRLGKIERGEDSRKQFMSDIAGFAEETVKELDETLKDVRIPRARLGPCPVCGHEIVENRKGYSCWAREDPAAAS
jgi:DNA topoisomerase-3